LTTSLLLKDVQLDVGTGLYVKLVFIVQLLLMPSSRELQVIIVADELCEKPIPQLVVLVLAGHAIFLIITSLDHLDVAVCKLNVLV
jgi:hypothetical protein